MQFSPPSSAISLNYKELEKKKIMNLSIYSWGLRLQYSHWTFYCCYVFAVSVYSEVIKFWKSNFWREAKTIFLKCINHRCANFILYRICLKGTMKQWSSERTWHWFVVGYHDCDCCNCCHCCWIVIIIIIFSSLGAVLLCMWLYVIVVMYVLWFFVIACCAVKLVC